MTWNVGEFVESQLLQRFGYVVWSESERWGVDGSYERRLDSQHAVLINLKPFHRGDGGGFRSSLELCVSRRDINDLRAEMSPDLGLGSWSGTVMERSSSRFAGRPPDRWNAHECSREDVASYLERWVPTLDEVANLSFVDAYVDARNPATGSYLHLQARIANRMLWGWDAEDEAMLVDDLERFSHVKEGHPTRVQMQAVYERRVAWIAAHPDGIERELTGR